MHVASSKYLLQALETERSNSRRRVNLTAPERREGEEEEEEDQEEQEEDREGKES